MKDKKLHYGFIVAIGIFVNILVCGGIFFGASGVFIVPVTRSLGIGQGEFSMYLTIQSFTMAVVMFAAPKLIGRFSFRKLDAVSAVVASAGFAMMGFARNVFLLYNGPSIVIAYAPCINHGLSRGMGKSMEEGKAAVECGFWPLYRYNPDREKEGKNPFTLDSAAPNGKLREFMMGENRFATLTRTFPERAEQLFSEAEEFVNRRYAKYKKLSES